MTPAQTVPAVLLHYAGGDLVRYATRTAPVMLSPVAEAVVALVQYKAALVAADDVDAVLAALAAARVMGE